MVSPAWLINYAASVCRNLKGKRLKDFRPTYGMNNKSADIMTQRHSMVRGNRVIATTVAFALLVLSALLTSMSAAKATSKPHVRALFSRTLHHTSAKLRDPRRNVAPAPDYLNQCATAGPNDSTCMRLALQAIDNARATEGVGPMILPKNYRKLSIARQTFVVTNLERVDRGLRPIKGLTGKLNANAKHAAAVREDPTLINAVMSLLGIRAYDSIWAGDFGPLASDYDWMYNDGYSSGGSINIDCATPRSTGCWGHRHAILDSFKGLRTILAGGGTSDRVGSSIAEILVGSTHRSFRYVYRWGRALAHGADGHKITA